MKGLQLICCMKRLILLFAVLVLFPSSMAQANMGLPMVAIFLPPMWLALVPIILVEAYIVARLTVSSLPRAVAGTAVANALSTIVGIPVMWVVLAICEIALFSFSQPGGSSFWSKLFETVVQAPWLGPNESQMYWMIPAALAVLAIPFFLSSVFIEAPIVRRVAKLGSPPHWMRTMALANAASYLGLGIVIATIQYFEWHQIGEPFVPVVGWLVDIVAHVVRFIAPGR